MILGQMGRRQRMTTAATGFTRGLLCALLALVTIAGVGGCIHQPEILPAKKQIVIDRRFVEYPSGYVLIPLVNDLNSPTAIAFDEEQNMLVAESGGPEPHIFGFHPDGKYFNIYPYKRNVTFYPTGFVMYGPISGMVARNGKIYVAHRDRDDKGMITALGYDGSHTTIVANLPAQGDYGLTDLVFNPQDGRLWFGVGTATNSGVVGVDNFEAGWLKRHPDVHDQFYSSGNPPGDIVLNGYRFDSGNPWAGLFGGADVARTGPFQPFGVSKEQRIRPSDTPNGAIYSVAADGGDRRIEAPGRFGAERPHRPEHR